MMRALLLPIPVFRYFSVCDFFCPLSPVLLDGTDDWRDRPCEFPYVFSLPDQSKHLSRTTVYSCAFVSVFSVPPLCLAPIFFRELISQTLL